MSQAGSDRGGGVLPHPDRSMMQATLQPPPVPPSALAMDRPRPPHSVSHVRCLPHFHTCWKVVDFCFLTLHAPESPEK